MNKIPLRVATLAVIAAITGGCDQHPLAPDEAIPTTGIVLQDSSLVHALTSASAKRRAHLAVDQRRGRFVALLHECEVFERLPDGRIRFARIALGSAEDIVQRVRPLRVVAARVADADGKGSLGMQCGVDVGRDAKTALRGVTYAMVRAALEDTAATRVYSEAQLETFRNTMSDAARAEGVANAHALNPRGSAPLALFAPAALTDCPVNNPPSQGCTTLGGMQIVADAMPPHSGFGGFDTYGYGDGWDGFYSRSDQIMVQQDQEQGCADTSCGGYGVIPPASIYGLCPIDENTDLPAPVDNGDELATAVCQGSGSAACMAQNPGVWIGSWLIQRVDFSGAHHTAVGTIDGYGLKVTELFNSDYLASYPPDPQQHIHFGAGTTHYAPIDDYKWIRVAGPYYIQTARDASLRATWEYGNRPYTFSSNRFVSAILKAAGITLTSNQKSLIGWAPGICWCGSCS